MGTDLTRRGFIATSAIALGAAGVSFGSVPDRKSRSRDLERGFGAARRVIFAVSDGMSMGTLSLADHYAHMVLGRTSSWMGLINRDDSRRALCVTSSANSVVTDSAAASTAWSLGSLVNNKSICYTPDGEAPDPILMRAKRAGFGTGIVSTTRITHATPAGFIANVPDRDMEHAIADQIVERAPDVAIGGGAKYFSERTLQSATARLVRRASDMEHFTRGRPALGILSDDHIPFGLDRTADDATLGAMARHALRLLDRDNAPFLLQIEGGRIDHAAHQNDAASLVREQTEFDEVLGELIDLVDSRDDTLLIATTDHGNANPGITDYVGAGREGLATLASARRSFEWIEKQMAGLSAGADRVAALREAVEFATTVAISEDDAKLILPRQTRRADLFNQANSFHSRLGSLLANHNHVGFLSKNHTSDHVEVTVLGAGADLLPRFMKISDMTGIIEHALGIRAVSV